MYNQTKEVTQRIVATRIFRLKFKNQMQIIQHRLRAFLVIPKEKFETLTKNRHVVS